MSAIPCESDLCGVLAEFDKPEAVLDAAKRVIGEGYRQVDAYTPFQVEGLAEAVGMKHSRVPRWVLTGGILGVVTAYALQYYCLGINYPINVGGRPLNSIPAFIPICFELTILFASFAALFGLFFLNGMPRPWQPVFNVVAFRRVTRDGFFLWIAANDAKFQLDRTKAFLEQIGARGVYEVQG